MVPVPILHGTPTRLTQPTPYIVPSLHVQGQNPSCSCSTLDRTPSKQTRTPLLRRRLARPLFLHVLVPEIRQRAADEHHDVEPDSEARGVGARSTRAGRVCGGDLGFGIARLRGKSRDSSQHLFLLLEPHSRATERIMAGHHSPVVSAGPPGVPARFPAPRRCVRRLRRLQWRLGRRRRGAPLHRLWSRRLAGGYGGREMHGRSGR